MRLEFGLKWRVSDVSIGRSCEDGRELITSTILDHSLFRQYAKCHGTATMVPKDGEALRSRDGVSHS